MIFSKNYKKISTNKFLCFCKKKLFYVIIHKISKKCVKKCKIAKWVWLRHSNTRNPQKWLVWIVNYDFYFLWFLLFCAFKKTFLWQINNVTAGIWNCFFWAEMWIVSHTWVYLADVFFRRLPHNFWGIFLKRMDL